MSETKIPSEITSSGGKDYAISLLIMIVPGGILVTLLKMGGLTGALVPLVVYFGGAVLVRNWRQKKGLVTSWKGILMVLGLDIAFFMLIPIILLIAS
jgi:hypothetical protein